MTKADIYNILWAFAEKEMAQPPAKMDTDFIDAVLRIIPKHTDEKH